MLQKQVVEGNSEIDWLLVEIYPSKEFEKSPQTQKKISFLFMFM